MMTLKDKPWWVALSLIVLVFFGSGGVIWQCQEVRLSSIKTAAELREREIAVYRDTLALSDSMSRIYDEHFKTASPDEFEKLMAPLKAQMQMRVSDYEALEKQLAYLEGRKAREIPLDFLAPSAPQNVRVEQ